MAQRTKEQAAAIKKLVRAANRRIERAYEQRDYGHARAMEYFVEKAIGEKKWSAASKDMTETQAADLLEKLNEFMGAKSTKRKEWKYMKRENIRKAAESLRKKKGVKYNLSDAELARAMEIYGDMYPDIVIHSKEQGRKQFYYIISKVQAAKNRSGGMDLDDRAIVSALESTMSDQEAVLNILTNESR